MKWLYELRKARADALEAEERREYRTTDNKVLRFLGSEKGFGFTPEQIAEATNIDIGKVEQAITRLVGRNGIEQAGNKWRIPPPKWLGGN